MIWITASDGTEEITTEEIEILPIPETGSWSKVETNDSVDNQTIVHNLFAIQSPASESPYNHHLAFQRLVIHQAIISQHPSEEIIYGLEEEEDNTEFVLVTGSNLDSHVTLPMSDDMILVGQRVFNNYDAEMSMTSDNPN
ncbi:unnamed protein product [Heterobilharzia americana]|nr:unnamed protein product [Heterobilharzia americana]